MLPRKRPLLMNTSHSNFSSNNSNIGSHSFQMHAFAGTPAMRNIDPRILMMGSASVDQNQMRHENI